MPGLQSLILKYTRRLTLVSGLTIVSLWTVLRHITNGVNFDVVGQIGLVQQWSQNVHAGAQLGATNYVLKVPLYWAVNHIGFLSPMNRLLMLALICNLATFGLLFILFEKIVKLYGVQDKGWLYVALLWLATIAGNVFWADYANSRNLETVGGILFVYLMLKFIRAPWIGTAGWAVLVGSVVFFADSLQLYICGLGVCAYGLGRWVARGKRDDAWLAGSLIGITGAGLAGAKVIRLVVEHWLHVSFLVAPKQPLKLDGPTLSHLGHSLFSATLDIFGANVFKRPYDLNSVRELLGLSLLLGAVTLLVQTRHQRRASVVMGLGATVIVVNYLIYIASGQAVVATTYRYLIMLPLILALLVANSNDSVSPKRRQYLQFSGLVVIGLSSVMLLGALVTHWPSRHSNDDHIYAAASFVTEHKLRYTLSSREAGITTTYFAQGKATVLPLLCTPDHQLVATDLFYDKAAFANFRHYQGPTAIIVPGNGIVSGSVVCDQAAITAQFGPPSSQQAIPGVGRELIYTPQQLRAGLPATVVN